MRLTRIVIALLCVMITSIVSLPAQIVTSSDSLDMCPNDCEQCARASQLYDALINDVTNEKVNEDIREYILNTDLRHVKDLTWNYANMLATSYIELDESQAEVTAITMLIMLHRLINTCDLITSMSEGREYNIVNYWPRIFNNFQISSTVLPSILIETITMINTYELYVQNNIVPQGYFFNGLRTFIEEIAYGDSRHMCRLMPEYEQTIYRLSNNFKEYIPDDINMEKFAIHGFKTCSSFLYLSQYRLNTLHLYNPNLATLYIDNLDDIIYLIQYTQVGSVRAQYLQDLSELSSLMGRGDEYTAAYERTNVKIWGTQGVVQNTYNRAVGINLGKLTVEYVEYQESLIERGYEFAYYTPLTYTGDIAEEDYDVFYEYCSKTCKLLGDMWKACKGASGNIHTLEQNMASIANFFDVEYISSYTLTLSFFIYNVDTLVALTTIENCLPVAEAAQEIMEIPQIPNVAAMYYNLGNYGLGDNITKFILLRNVPLFVENAAYENPNNVATYVLDALEALTLSTTDYSAFISEYCDKAAPIIDKINLSNFGLDYVQQQIYLNIQRAELLATIGEYDRALEIADAIVNSIKRSKISKDDKRYLNALLSNMLMGYYYENGDYEEFIEHYHNIEPFVEDNSLILDLYNLSTITYSASQVGDIRLMGESAETFIDKMRSGITNTMFNLRGEAREMYWDNWSQGGSKLIDSYYTTSTLEDNPLIGAIYDWNLMCKGVLLTASNIFDYRLQHHENSEVRDLYEQYKLYAMELDRSSSLNTNMGEVMVMQTDARNMEEALLTILRNEFKEDEYSQLAISWQDVQEALPENGVAIEFMRIDSEASGGAKYVALVLRKEWKSPRLVEVCSEEALAPYISLDRRTNLTLYNSVKSKRLYEIVWGNVDEYLTPNDIVYYSTDGLLHQTNPESMRVADSDAKLYADDLYDLRRVSSTREIALEHRDADYARAALFGNLNYNMGDSEVESIDIAEGNTTYITSRTLGAGVSNMVPRTSLPWSEDLIYNVSDILSTADVISDIYLHEQGTENAFKQLSGSATDIIHLYTHGFYMEGITEYQDSDVELSPMMRSGLVMAGSPEVSLNSDNDGLLLAREIADMDLSYVDIVFLSACQTAQGEITSDGVVGIQRGLKQAGVNTIIMTLWEVDAMMSVYLVEEFYRALSQPGATKREAFREARRKARENYPTLDWAAYIMLD